MMRSSARRFRPNVDGTLEARKAPAQIIPLIAAVSINHGTQMHPSIALAKAGQARTPTYQYGNTPRNFFFKSKLDRKALPDLTAAEQSNRYLNTYVVSYNNKTATSFPWAAITVKLDPGLRYMPGRVNQPAGTNLVTSIDPNGIQTVSLVFPHGIPSGTQGLLAIGTKYKLPSLNG